MAIGLLALLVAGSLAGRAAPASAQAPATYSIPITYAGYSNYIGAGYYGLYGGLYSGYYGGLYGGLYSCGYSCGLGSYGVYPSSYGYNAWPYIGGYNSYWPGYYPTNTAVVNVAVKPGASSPLWVYCTGPNGAPVWVNAATTSTAGLFC